MELVNDTILIDLKFIALKKEFPTSDDYIKYISFQFINEINTQLKWNMKTDDIKIANKLVKVTYDNMKKTIYTHDQQNITIYLLKLAIQKTFEILAQFENNFLENQQKVFDMIDALFNENKLTNYYSIRENFSQYVNELQKKNYNVISYIITHRVFKQEVLRKLFSSHKELENLHLECFNNVNELRNLIGEMTKSKRNFILTYRPFSINKQNIPNDFFYFCSEEVKILKKLKIEQKLAEYPILFEFSCISQVPSALEFIINQEKSSSHKENLEVGYWFLKEKFDDLQRIHQCFNSKFPIKYTPIDLRLPFSRKLNAFIHKISEINTNLNDPYNHLRLKNYDYMESKNRDILFFDYKEALEFIANRDIIHNKLNSILNNEVFHEELKAYFENNSKSRKFKFKIPAQILIEPMKCSVEEAINLLTSSKIDYPVILKTKSINSTNSHLMGVAFDNEGLKNLENNPIFRKEDHVIQQLIDHEQYINKVYIIGERFFTFQKQAFPMKSKDEYGHNHFIFNSQNLTSEHFNLKGYLNYKEIDDIFDSAIVVLLNKFIEDNIGLSLYGIKLVNEKITGDYVILSVDYFPNFEEVDKFDEFLKQYIYKSYNDAHQIVNSK